MAVCEHCGVEAPDGFHFCGNCGAPLPEEPAQPRRTRKVVTALFCDVTGSTALGEELDPEVLRGVMNRYFAMIRVTIERHGGTVEKFIGDAVMAVFGIPLVREDDALRAVRAAAEIRDQLPAVAQQVGVTLRFRTGINTGAVLMSEGENYATGDAVNVAARFEQAAAPGDIVLGGETLRLVRDAVAVEPLPPLELKGKSAPVPAFRLLSVDPVAPGVARHLDAPLIGRERELRFLTEAWDRVVQESGCHLFTLLGMAGVGKSRLVAELLGSIGEQALVLRGRCLAYGEGITFWPLIEALTAAGEPAQPVVERLRRGGAAVPEELFWEVRRLLEALTSDRPVVLHIDDLQWGEAMLLDLLDHVVDLSRGAPILVLCTARPELLEDRPGWGGGKFNGQTVLLEPLGASEALALLEQLGDGLDTRARDHVVAASQGNPLFLEEMVALARESGTTQVPSTIQALLAARLERLDGEERALLERGAVEGEVFHRLAVMALADENLAANVDGRLAGLVRRELIRPHPATLQGDEAFRFRHLLIRDAAYDALPKADRAELHERFAGWLTNLGVSVPELDEIIGWHLEQVVRYRRELGQAIDPQLAGQAAQHLYLAGRRASDRDDGAAARTLLERALALTPDGGPHRPAIAVELADQLVDAGAFDRVEGLLAEAERDARMRPLAGLVRFEWLMQVRAGEAIPMLESQLPSIVGEFERQRDFRGLAKAHFESFLAHNLAGRVNLWAEEAKLAAEYAGQAGDEGKRARALSWYLSALYHGEANAQVIKREVEAVEAARTGPYLTAGVCVARAWLAMAEARFDLARSLIERGAEAYVDMGALPLAGACHQEMGEIEMAAGQPAAAQALLERGDRLLTELGEQSYRSTIQAMLAEASLLAGDLEAAAAAAELAERLSAPEDIVNFIYIHGVRSALALEAGDHDAAERWARSAVSYADSCEFYDTRGIAYTKLSRVLAARGDSQAAVNAALTAIGIYERKGDQPRLAQAEADLQALTR